MVKTNQDGDQIVLASHDEIDEGQEIGDLMRGVKEIGKSLYEFLDAFKSNKLVKSYYDIE